MKNRLILSHELHELKIAFLFRVKSEKILRSKKTFIADYYFIFRYDAQKKSEHTPGYFFQKLNDII